MKNDSFDIMMQMLRISANYNADISPSKELQESSKQ
jgi:hypothetical protein